MDKKFKVECIDDSGSGFALKKGNVYEATEIHPPFNDFRIDNRTWRRSRFKVLGPAEAKPPTRLRCIQPAFGLTLNKIYDAIDYNEKDGGYNIINDHGEKQFNTSFRFEIVSSSPITIRSMKASNADGVDAEEIRLRSILTKPSNDPYTCQSCGMPKPKEGCKWH